MDPQSDNKNNEILDQNAVESSYGHQPKFVHEIMHDMIYDQLPTSIELDENGSPF